MAITSWAADTETEQVLKELSNRIEGKTFVITGPSQGGLGASVAKALAAHRPAKIILAGRNESKINPVAEEIRSSNQGVEVVVVKLDLLDNASVKAAAKEIASAAPQIDVLINNAGVMATKDFVKSKDGVESQFAANYLGHFLLTHLLLPSLKSGSRIVNVASQGYQLGEVRFDDYNFEDGKKYNRWVAYGQAKTAGVLFTSALGKKSKDKSIGVYAPHPGVVLESQLAVNAQVDEAGWGEAYMLATERAGGVAPPPDMKSMSQGVACILVPALDPALESHSGSFLVDNQPSEPRDYARGQQNEDALWELSEKLVKDYI